jgi:hypothetical protein
MKVTMSVYADVLSEVNRWPRKARESFVESLVKQLEADKVAEQKKREGVTP